MYTFTTLMSTIRKKKNSHIRTLKIQLGPGPVQLVSSPGTRRGTESIRKKKDSSIDIFLYGNKGQKRRAFVITRYMWSYDGKEKRNKIIQQKKKKNLDIVYRTTANKSDTDTDPIVNGSSTELQYIQIYIHIYIFISFLHCIEADIAWESETDGCENVYFFFLFLINCQKRVHTGCAGVE